MSCPSGVRHRRPAVAVRWWRAAPRGSTGSTRRPAPAPHARPSTRSWSIPRRRRAASTAGGAAARPPLSLAPRHRGGARCGDDALYVDLAGTPLGLLRHRRAGTGRLHPVQLCNVRPPECARPRRRLPRPRDAPPPEACPPCGENAACVFGLLSHGLVAAILLYLLVVLLLSPRPSASAETLDGGWPTLRSPSPAARAARATPRRARAAAAAAKGAGDAGRRRPPVL